MLGHQVCDACPRDPAERPAAGVVLHSDTSLDAAHRLGYPGFVIGLRGMSTQAHVRPGKKGSDDFALRPLRESLARPWRRCDLDPYRGPEPRRSRPARDPARGPGSRTHGHRGLFPESAAARLE